MADDPRRFVPYLLPLPAALVFVPPAPPDLVVRRHDEVTDPAEHHDADAPEAERSVESASAGLPAAGVATGMSWAQVAGMMPWPATRR